MTETELVFEARRTHWCNERDGLCFLGEYRGHDIAFIATAEALASMFGLNEHPSDLNGTVIFDANPSAFYAIAHHLWEQNNREAEEYLITSEIVEDHIGMR